MSEVRPPVDSIPNSEAAARIRPVLDVLQNLQYDAMKLLLDAKMKEAQPVDRQANIAIVKLEDIKPVSVDGRIYEFHAARVPQRGIFVIPHYHPPKGQEPGQTPVQGPDEEPYFFFSEGEMNTARCQNGQVGEWQRKNVSSGEIYIVEPNMVHSLRNLSPDQDLDFAFACPSDHLVNYTPEHPEGNRIMTTDMPNGMPRDDKIKPWRYSVKIMSQATIVILGRSFSGKAGSG